jgi:hypothetical protein
MIISRRRRRIVPGGSLLSLAILVKIADPTAGSLAR